MKRSMQIVVVVLVAGALLAFVNPASQAGRSGGPLNRTVMVPIGQSVFFDIAFDAGLATVSIRGNGGSIMQVYVYDSDGHVTTGVGNVDWKSASVNVYRPGMFRVEVANVGIYPNTVIVSTN
jgi:hypothetical protein